jgi:hypothetical protein
VSSADPRPGGSQGDRPAAETVQVREALLDLCLERSFPEVTLAMLLGRSGVDRDAFDAQYADLEDCFLQTYVVFRDDLMGRIAVVVETQPTWRERLRAVAYTMVEYMEEDERRTHFIVTEVRRAGERVLLAMEEAFEEMFDLLDAGRGERAGAEPSRAIAEAIGGSIFFRMNAAFEEGSLTAVRAMIPEMMYMAVLPYLGPEAAAEELEAPVPRRD